MLRRLTLAALCIAAVLPSAASAAPVDQQAVNSVSQMVATNLPKIPQTPDGLWDTPNGGGEEQGACLPCQAGPAVAAAAEYAYTGASNQTLKAEAIRAIDTLVSINAQNGLKTQGGLWVTWSSTVIGNTYVELLPYLDPATQASWQQALASYADFLVSDGDSVWYANGNVNLSYVAAFYFAWRATGITAYQADYHSELNFVEHPPSRWSANGWGLWSNAFGTAGYLGESGGGYAGFDADYTQAQLDIAAQLYTLSGDPQVGSLMGVEMNELTPRVTNADPNHPGDWVLDTAGGSRHPAVADLRPVPFWTPALAVMAWLGNWNGLAPYVAPQVKGGVVNALNEGISYGSSVNLLKAYGQDAATVIEAAQVASGQIRQQRP